MWTSGLYPNDIENPSIWISHWGDGLKAGNEKWDDGNTEDGDGCKNDCASIENGYICNGGSQTSKDTCTLWTSGLYPNDIENPSIWISHWGDGLKAGNEKWDDGNTEDGDGCKNDCASIENGYICNGGSQTSKDTCTLWTSGLYPNDIENPSIWIFHWGDGLKAGNEKWDDGNTEDGDGCKNDCASIENGYICNGGSQTSKDTCTLWTSGLYPNDIENPSIWISHWGDGLKAGNEKWDDGNTEDGDGCKNDCASIENGYICNGGSQTSKDTCTLWTSGLYPNDIENPSIWISHWGDGLKAGNEKWDDGNTEDGDGWSSDWTFIEDGWVWSGGTASTCDFWQYWDKGFYVNDYTNPNHWISKWGDGKREGSEKCDDNNEWMNLFSN